MDFNKLIHKANLSKKNLRIRYKNRNELITLLSDLQNTTDLKWFPGKKPLEYIPDYETGHILIMCGELCCDHFSEEEYEEILEEGGHIYWYESNNHIIPSKQFLMDFLQGE